MAPQTKWGSFCYYFGQKYICETQVQLSGTEIICGIVILQKSDYFPIGYVTTLMKN